MALNTTVLFILGVLFDLIAIFILIGNVLIIIAVYRYRRLQTITNRFVVSLACSDFLAGLFISWQSAFNYNPSLDNVAITCISRLIQIQPSYCSVLHLLAIAIDRYLAVLHPLRYHEFMTARVSNIMIALSWIFSTFFTSLIIGTSRFELGVTQCMLNDIVPNGVLIFVFQVTFRLRYALYALLVCAHLLGGEATDEADQRAHGDDRRKSEETRNEAGTHGSEAARVHRARLRLLSRDVLHHHNDGLLLRRIGHTRREIPHLLQNLDPGHLLQCIYESHRVCSEEQGIQRGVQANPVSPQNTRGSKPE